MGLCTKAQSIVHCLWSRVFSIVKERTYERARPLSQIPAKLLALLLCHRIGEDWPQEARKDSVSQVQHDPFIYRI
jgi:hypothetical protein